MLIGQEARMERLPNHPGFSPSVYDPAFRTKHHQLYSIKMGILRLGIFEFICFRVDSGMLDTDGDVSDYMH